MNKNEFVLALKNLGIDITEEKLNKLDKYYDLLIEWNNKINLTRITDKEEVYLKHFYDSLTLTKVIDLNTCKNLLDFGTGAGFPGMVLKIFFPELKVTLLDSNNKKIKFLTELQEKICVDNLELINTRVENIRKERLNSYDVITARAVANMPVLTELALPLIKNGGYFIALKGGNKEEIAKSMPAITKSHGEVKEIKTFSLPNEGGARNIVKIKKINDTLPSELRPYEKIIKKPLAKI